MAPSSFFPGDDLLLMSEAVASWRLGQHEDVAGARSIGTRNILDVQALTKFAPGSPHLSTQKRLDVAEG